MRPIVLTDGIPKLITVLSEVVPGVCFKSGWFEAQHAKNHDETVKELGMLDWAPIHPDDQDGTQKQHHKVAQGFKELFVERYPTELSLSSRLVCAYVETAEPYSCITMYVIERQV